MPRAPRITYADRVNYHLCVNGVDAFNPDHLVEEIVRDMKAHGEVVTRCTRGCISAYLKSLRIQRALSKHSSDHKLVQLGEKLQKAIDRIRESDMELSYSNIARISSLLRVVAGRLKSLTAKELRDRVIELLDELDALRAAYNTLKREHEELQVDRDMLREERDELQEENRALKARNAHLEAVNAELAASRNRSVPPARESSSANIEDLYTAPSSPQLGQEQPSAGGNLSRVPTEIIPPTTPPRASISRIPSGLPTPPRTDARRPIRWPSHNDSRSSSSSHRSFRENTPGAASVRGATPGSPSLRRHSPPLRQASQNHGQAPAREPSYSVVRSPFRDIRQSMQDHCDVQCEQVDRLEEQAVQRHIEQEQRQNALEDELHRAQAELVEVRCRLEKLQERHCEATREYQNLLARYTALRTRVQALNATIKTLASEATALLDGPDIPPTGGTASM
ncbi:hypothetical protein LXA43DRAFT_1000860 [Ganoderma leucocontextum]|nr:hypothetical protein LXA43DRAFT_1000860 [Ganoderma leucocontextum]